MVRAHRFFISAGMFLYWLLYKKTLGPPLFTFNNASFKMPKAKVHSGAAKRFKKTGAGCKRKSANKSHILTKMTTKRKRQLRGTSIVDAADKPAIDKMMRAN